MAKWIKEIIKASRSKNYESDVFAKHELCLELIFYFRISNKFLLG
jgi:hypothetical protein